MLGISRFMRAGIVAAASLVLPALTTSCAPVPRDMQSVRLPPDAFGTYAGGDQGAVSLARWAFASSINTRHDPADAARAIAAVEYLGSAVGSGIEFTSSSVPLGDEMLSARQAVREAASIDPKARPQVVVRHLLQAANAIENEDQAAAIAALTGTPFLTSPEHTMARIADLPFMPVVNRATQDAATAYRESTSRGGR